MSGETYSFTISSFPVVVTRLLANWLFGGETDTRPGRIRTRQVILAACSFFHWGHLAERKSFLICHWTSSYSRLCSALSPSNEKLEGNEGFETARVTTQYVSFCSFFFAASYDLTSASFRNIYKTSTTSCFLIFGFDLSKSPTQKMKSCLRLITH